ncbi:hypothetical protein FRB95_010087 [Tulasnella sp. JGI-2019a]|nr:hypothetical protein FRB95_010087 [Tulasnella sp. JGI-2019a]
MMPPKRTKSSIAPSVQALTLHAKGARNDRIKAVTSIKKESFKATLEGAKRLDTYVPRQEIMQAFVHNAQRIGRPKIIAPALGSMAEDVVTRNSTIREFSLAQIAEAGNSKLTESHP